MITIGTSTGEMLIRGEPRYCAPNVFQDPDVPSQRGESLDGPYMTAYWPKSGFAGDVNGDGGLLDPWMNRFEQLDIDTLAAGASTRYAISGVTRDVLGSAVPGVTCHLFVTASDLLLDTVVSDANGVFRLITPLYPDTHYVQAYKAGAPDVSGCSVNTLIGG